MRGHILLAGGGEFTPGMEAADRRALELAGGPGVPVRIIPAAAAPDQNHLRAGANGVRWFQFLGARDVSSLNLIDARSAAEPGIAAELEAAKLIYLLGGFPGYLARTLKGSLAWAAVLQAYAEGAVVAGSSAGAMVLAEHLYEPYENRILEGLNLLPGACVLPHYSEAGREWEAWLKGRLPGGRLPGVRLLRIEAGAALIDDGPGGEWQLYTGL